MTQELTVTIRAGRAVCVYDDALVGLLADGEATIERVSDVEPASGGGWEARMRGGPTLGPFPTRGEALAAERRWLTAQRGL
jgi:hypothetical protein